MGCAPVQTCVPGQPLLAGDYEGRIGVSFTTSNIANYAVQGGVYWGLSDQDVLGLTFNSWALPSRVSYARYFYALDHGHWNGNIQAHLGSLLGGELNPVLELDAAVSYSDGNVGHVAKVGMGYFGPAWFELIAKRTTLEGQVAPILGYQVHSKSVLAEVELIYGMSLHQVDNHLKYNKWDKGGLVVRHEDIKQIEQVGKDYSEAVWEVRLVNGDMITIAGRDPYADCFPCAHGERWLSAYLPSTDYRSLWIYLNRSEGLQLLPLNMHDVLSRFENGENLNLVPDSSIKSMILETARSGNEDIGVFVGYRSQVHD